MNKKTLLLRCLLFFALCPLFPDEAETGAEQETVQAAEIEESYTDDDFIDDDFLDFGEGEEITVMGTPETPAQTKVVSKEEIERIAAPDIPTLLRESLNIGITQHGAYGNASDINIRGFNTKRVAILIDGVLANSAMSGEFDFNTIDMNNIESIEVIYGGSDSKYNVTGALGGVINIITIKSRQQGLNLGIDFKNTSYIPGKYRTWKGTQGEAHYEDLADTQQLGLSLSRGGENYSWGVNAFGTRAMNHFLYEDSYLHRIRRKEFNEVYDAGGGINFARSFSNLSKLNGSTDFYFSNKNIPTSGYASALGIQNDYTLRNNLALDMPVLFRDDISMEAGFSYTWARMDYERNAAPFARHDQHGFTVNNRWGWYPHTAITVRAGWDYRFILMDSTGVGLKNRHDGGVYLTGEFSLPGNVKAIPSIKGAGDGKNFVPVPKLGFFWDIADFVTFRNNYYRSFKFPDFNDLYWSAGGSRGNPDLKPEDGWGADLGADFRFPKAFSAETTFFAQYVFDTIHWHQTFGGLWEPQNIGESAFFGADARVKKDFNVSWGPIRKISPSLSYQYLLTYLLSYGYKWEDNKRIPYQPMHTAGASLDISWTSGSLLFSAHYESLRYYSVTNLIMLEPYLLLTLNINQKIGKYITAVAVIRNLLDESYESYNRYPMPGFNFTLGVNAQFDVN